MLMKQVRTERGIIMVDNLVFTNEQAEREGYALAFRSGMIGLDVYKSTTDTPDDPRHYVILLDREICKADVIEQLKDIPALNEGTYHYYNILEENNLFKLKGCEIPVYNSMVDELNQDCEWLDKFKADKEFFELHGDGYYKERYEHHCEVYESYMQMQEDAIMSGGSGFEGLENDSKEERDYDRD